MGGGFVLIERHVFAGVCLLAVVYIPRSYNPLRIAATVKEGRAEKTRQAWRPIGPPQASRARAQSDSVEGSDDGGQVDTVGGGPRNGVQCVQINRGYRL